jgi:hypothetical protein
MKNVTTGLICFGRWRCCRAVCLMVIGMTIILAFIISVIGYYLLIKLTALSWVVNGYRNSWLQLSFIPARDG